LVITLNKIYWTNDIHIEIWDMLFNFPRTNQNKEKKNTSEPSALLFKRGLLWWWYGFGIGLTHVSGFGIGAGVTLLFVRFLERGDDKCRDREAFGWDAGNVTRWYS